MSSMRISGLASGMDIDGMVEKLMVAQRAPMDKLEQQKQTYEWQRDAYREVNKTLNTFDTYIADNFILKNLNAKTATSSNADLVGVKATSAAVGSLSIESVSQLATAARGISDKPIPAVGSTKLSTLGIGSTSISLKSIQADGTLAEKATEIKIDSSMTINEFVSKINGSAAGVSAVFENGRLSITAKNTGKSESGAEVQVTAGADVFGKLGFTSLEGKTSGDLATGGTNARFEVNGIATERTTNTFTLNGFNITLNKNFNEDNRLTPSGIVAPVTMTATTNVDEIVDRLKDFVNTYNGLIKDLNAKKNEEVYRNFKPLTSLQRKEMEENEIKLWEEKAKSGMLRGDSIIQSGLNGLRDLLYHKDSSILNPKYNTLYNIGISSSRDWTTGGALEINEAELREALQEDPDAVVKLLTGEGEGSSEGYFRQIRKEIDKIEKNIDSQAGRATMTEAQYTLGKSLQDINQRLTDWQTKLQSIENRYYQQFSVMETMINKSNSQSSMLMSQFYS